MSVQEIVTSNFTKVEELLSKNYVCVSVVGKVYGNVTGKKQIERIRNLNVFRFYHHLRSKDYYACYYLYNAILQKKGIETLLKEIKQLLNKHNKTKIALCDNSTGNDFGFRHILRCFLLENGVQVYDTENIDLSIQQGYWKQDLYKQAGHFNLTDEFVGNALEEREWTFAKTMPKNPHFYIIRSKISDFELFLHLVAHIRYYGKPEIYEGMLYRVFYWNAYKYWTMPQDLTNEKCDLINRKLHKTEQNEQNQCF